MNAPLMVGASHSNLAPCLAWCSLVFCMWRHIVLLRDLAKPHYLGIIRIYSWELLAVCHHPDNLSDHKYCDSKDIRFM